MKYMLILLGLINVSVYAHHANLATLVFLQNNKGNYSVQLHGALTGVEAEVNKHYSKDAYKTADEFKALAIDHFQKTLSLTINQKDMVLTNPTVRLGHGTQFTANIADMPANVTSIQLKNTFFKDIYRNQTTVVFENTATINTYFPNKKYTLTNANQHNLDLQFTDGKWQTTHVPKLIKTLGVQRQTTKDSSIKTNTHGFEHRHFTKSEISSGYIAFGVLLASIMAMLLFTKRNSLS